jgi:hypothetical protein
MVPPITLAAERKPRCTPPPAAAKFAINLLLDILNSEALPCRDALAMRKPAGAVLHNTAQDTMCLPWICVKIPSHEEVMYSVQARMSWNEYSAITCMPGTATVLFKH